MACAWVTDCIATWVHGLEGEKKKKKKTLTVKQYYIVVWISQHTHMYVHAIIDMHRPIYIIQLEADWQWLNKKSTHSFQRKTSQGTKRVLACLWHQFKNKYDNKNHHEMAYGTFLYTYYSLIFYCIWLDTDNISYSLGELIFQSQLYVKNLPLLCGKNT